MKNFFCRPFVIVNDNYDLLKQLVKRNISARYKGTVFGSVWTVAQPFMLLMVYTFVFSVVFKSRWGGASGENLTNDKYAFAMIIFCGMTVFNIFSDSITNSPNLIISNPNYVKKVIFPLEILSFAQVITSVIVNFVWLIILFIGSVLLMNSLSWTMLLLPIIFIPYILMTIGLSFFLSSVGVFFRDISQFCLLIVNVLFMGTPIFYSLDMVPGKFKYVLMLNPLTWFVEETRAVFLFKQYPNWIALAIISLISIICFYSGFVWLQKTKKGFADVI